MKYILIFFIVTTTQQVLAQSCKSTTQDNLAAIASTVCSNDAIAMIDQLKSQGFRCDEPSAQTPKRGILCKGKLSGYSQPVRIYVSPNYQKQTKATINLHFHGHRLNGIDTFQTNSGDTKGHGDYGARLVESGSTELLVIPESIGNCTTYDNELNVKAEMQGFASSLEQVTGLKSPDYKLTAHSGGARILNKTLLNGSLDGRVKSVGLFDAIYEDQLGVKKYLQTARDNKVVVHYLDKGTTQKMTTYFKTTTIQFQNQLEIVAISKAKSGHMAIINQGLFTEHLKYTR